MIISPRVIIVNALGRELELKQEGVESSAGYEDPFAGGGGGGGFQGYDYDGDDFGDDDYYDHDYGEGGGAGAKGSARAARRGSYASLRHKHMKGGVGHGMGGSSMGETGGAQLGNGMFFGVDDQRPFHWPNGRGDRSLRLRLREYGAQWSGRFSIDWDPSTMGTGSGHFEAALRLRNAHTHAVSFVRVEIALMGSTVQVTLGAVEGPPYHSQIPFRLKNETIHTFTFRQTGVKNVTGTENKVGAAGGGDREGMG